MMDNASALRTCPQRQQQKKTAARKWVNITHTTSRRGGLANGMASCTSSTKQALAVMVYIGKSTAQAMCVQSSRRRTRHGALAIASRLTDAMRF
jgi:hypothetical protein